MSLIEVEAKYRVRDPGEIRRRLDELGAEPGKSVCQSDEYYAHPQRNFAETNEAFRLRSIGNENRLTYKGPLLDEVTKTRREIEVEFSSGATSRDAMRQMLTALGFRSVHVVEKQRQTFHLRREELEFEVCLDHVALLGDFIELETVADLDWQNARGALVRLAGELDLVKSERRSYLELLMALADSNQSGD